MSGRRWEGISVGLGEFLALSVRNLERSSLERVSAMMFLEPATRLAWSRK